MGVTGLWKLIDSSGKPVPLETLENKILAIDISIWLHQVVKGFQDNKGGTLPNAHLLGLFHRLCKLLFYKIRPVFVFDGGVPWLKRETMMKRSQSKNKLLNEADRLQALLLTSLAKEKVVQQALGGQAADILAKSPVKKVKEQPQKDDMFILPPLKNEESFSSDNLDESSDFETKPHVNLNLQNIDVDSSNFKTLPADVRHEILTDIKETRKQSSWGRLHELPVQSDDFSSFQMKRLLKRRKVQVSLEDAEKEMGGNCLSIRELEQMLTEEGVVPSTSGKRISSDDQTRFLMISSIKKAMEDAIQEEKKPKKEEVKEEIPDLPEELGTEYDEDLQKAIEMSLFPTSEGNFETVENNSEIKMSKTQKKHLSGVADTLARGYMMEYAGMSKEDVDELLGTGENFDEHLNDTITQLFEENGILEESPKIISDSDSSDSDFEEVVDAKEAPKPGKPSLEIVIDPSKKLKDDEDIFADVFVPPKPKPVDKKEKLLEILRDLKKERDRIKSGHLKLNTQLPVICEEEDELEKTTSGNLNPSTSQDEECESGISIDKSENKSNSFDVTSENDTSKNNSTVEPITDDSAIEMENKTEEPTSKSECEKRTKANEEIITNSELNSIPLKSSKSCTNFEIQKDISCGHENQKKDIKETEKETMEKALNEIIFTKSEENKNELSINSNLTEDKEMVKENVLKKLSNKEAHNQTIEEQIISSASTNKNDSEIQQVMGPDLLQSKEVIDLDQQPLRSTEIVITPIKTDPKSILEELKRQKEAISQISLSEIPLETSTITISDSDSEKTPSKKRKLTEYFVVTPSKSQKTPTKEEDEVVPKVKSPFFVRKTPKSSEKKRNSAKNTPIKDHKASKSLFGKDDLAKDDLLNQVKPLDLLTEASDLLKSQKTEDELKEIALEIRKEKQDLEAERNKQNRFGMSITEQMSKDCQQLLKLFGIPYIQAPMEAEAQCAFLNAIDLTQGTITDDSDIWLFGGTTVYKNFFDQSKRVMEFRMNNIEQLFNVDRKKLILLAMLVGSDYTSGINGVGAVTALEIIAQFPSTPEREGETNEFMSMMSGLRKFKEWWRCGKTVQSRGVLRSKLKNIAIADSFPSREVIEAYLYPRVDGNQSQFSWGTPDVETLREFTKKNFGWTRARTDELLLPVMKKMEEKKAQASIKNYFKVSTPTTLTGLKVSKRVENAIKKMGSGYQSEEETKPKKKNSTRKRKESKKDEITSPKKVKGDDPDSDCIVIEEEPEKKLPSKPSKSKNPRKTKAKSEPEDEPSTSTAKKPRTPRIPNTVQKIPQKEKQEQKKLEDKNKAIEIFKAKRVK